MTPKFYLERQREHQSTWDSVWQPICDAIEQALKALGWQEDDGARFRVYTHKDKDSHPDGTLFAMQMHARQAYTVDRQGWGVKHSQAGREHWRLVTDAEAIRYTEAMARKFLRTGESKFRQPPPMAVDFGRPYVLATMQMPRDSVIQFHSPITAEEFVWAMAGWAQETQTLVLFKPHVAYRSQAGKPEIRSVEQALTEATRDNPNARVVTGNIQSLIAGSMAVATINSGTGFEALIHGKPVVTFGRSDFQAVTLQAEKQNTRGILEYIAQQPHRVDAAKFCTYYLREHCFWFDGDGTARARLSNFVTQQAQQWLERQSSSS